MTTRVLVIGKPHRVDSVLGEVSDRVSHSSHPVLHCSHPAELIPCLYQAQFTESSIDVLDIFDHGAPGAILLGDDILFASDDDPTTPLVGRDVAEQIKDLLAFNAQVRLLGCDTAGASPEHPTGRLLLLKLAHALGEQRTVFGTLAPVEPGDFDDHGFIEERAIDLLYSSQAALDHPPPTYNERQINLGRWRPFP